MSVSVDVEALRWRTCPRCRGWSLLHVGDGRHCDACAAILRISRPIGARTWMPRPNRRWGWVSNDGYELEWRRAESGHPFGYYLFGPALFGIWCGCESKRLILTWAEQTIAEARP